MPLAQSGSGTLAGGAHSDTWAEVRRMDSAKIASAINRQLVKPLLERAFPDKPQLAYFSFDTEATPSPGEVFDDAAKARAAGYPIDQAELEEKTGYKLVRDTSGQGEGFLLNKEVVVNSRSRRKDDLNSAAAVIAEAMPKEFGTEIAKNKKNEPLNLKKVCHPRNKSDVAPPQIIPHLFSERQP